MKIEITNAAIAAVKEAQTSENLAEPVCLRVVVRAGGCSGFSYALAFEQKPREDDELIEQDGIRLLLDPKSGAYLSGATLDHKSGLNGTGFVFTNPNATGGCGCGNSFCV